MLDSVGNALALRNFQVGSGTRWVAPAVCTCLRLDAAVSLFSVRRLEAGSAGFAEQPIQCNRHSGAH